MSIRFQRVWNLSITRNDVEILSLTSEVNTYRIAFECHPYASLGAPSFISLEVYNLNQSQYSKLREGDSLTFSVGYKTQGQGVIFSGQIYSFYGRDVATNQSKDYIFSIYGLAYSTNGIETEPKVFSLPSGTILSQASVISSFYGYKPSGKISLKDPESASSPSIHIVANNMDDAVMQFYRKTKYSIILDAKSKTYYLVSAQPTKEQRADIARSSDGYPLIRVDDNTGMIGYPHADSMTGFVKVSFLIDPKVNIFSRLSIDVSNAIIDNINKTLSQKIVSNLRLYRDYYVISLSIRGDTRSPVKSWYQEILAIGL